MSEGQGRGCRVTVPCDSIGPAQRMDCAGISDGQAIRSCSFAMFDLFDPATAVRNITNINLEHLA